MNYPFSSVKKEQCALVQNTNGTIYICIMKRGLLGWETLDSLSPANWRENRDTISENMEKLLKKETKKQEEIIKSSNTAIAKTKDLFYKIYKNLSINDKKLFLKQNKTSWVAKESCSVCLNKASTRIKCIHIDCEGMCDECAKDMLDCDGKCKACSKSQLLLCPVCYEENSVEKMCKSKTCSHYVCWSCYGKAHHCGHPIESCPTCRAVFIDIPEEDSSDDDDDLYDSDLEFQDEGVWDDIDIETINAIEQNIRENVPNSTYDDVIDAINMIINNNDEIQNIPGIPSQSELPASQIVNMATVAPVIVVDEASTSSAGHTNFRNV
jgi:hypothetical protein